MRGKIVRMSLLRDPRALVREAILQGAQTIVAVGSDRTFTTLATALVAADADALLGYLPLDDREPLARMLGLPPGVLAVDTLASRLLTSLDMGRAGSYSFLSELEIPAANVRLRGRPKWEIILNDLGGSVRVVNLGWRGEGKTRQVYDPRDGFLTLLVEPSTKKIWTHKRNLQTALPFRTLTIEHLGSDPLPVRLDHILTLKTPLQIEVVPKRLRVIVGRERLI